MSSPNLRFVSMGFHEGGAPPHVALVRGLLITRDAPFGDAEREWPDGYILAFEDEVNGYQYALVPAPPDEDPAPWNIPIAIPEGWRLDCPELGRYGYDVAWSSGHKSASAVVCDTYAADCSVLLAVVTPAALQRKNAEMVGSPTIEQCRVPESTADLSGSIPC